MGKPRIGRAMDRSQLASLPLIKAARPHVDILSLDLELPTTVQLRPCLDPLEQRRTNTLAASVWGDSNVPQDGQITPAFQHRQLRGVECDGRPTDSAGRHACREERPI